MDEGYSLGLAILDFLPNIAFIIASIFLALIAKLISGKKYYYIIIAGSILVAAGGLSKAIWKTIVTMGGTDIHWMSNMQFIVMAPGFLALLISVIHIIRKDKIRSQNLLPAMLAWKIPLIMLMTLASLTFQGLLVFLSIKKKTYLAAVVFLIAFAALLTMGYMTSLPQSINTQWIEEIINSTGQIGYLVGCILLYRKFSQNFMV